MSVLMIRIMYIQWLFLNNDLWRYTNMNNEWSDLNKEMQLQIRKESTFYDGITTLMKLRQQLIDELYNFKEKLSLEEFNAIPFIGAKGYNSKTITYSIWHIFRIEDIVSHSLIIGDEQVFFKKYYQKRIQSPIITTGNELVREQISEFSKQLDIEELYQYITEVKNSTDDLLKQLKYIEIKNKITDINKEHLKTLEVVSHDENAYWLIDYWCGKDVRGLIQMPFSRHWIMHIEACLRIMNKIHPNN